MDVLADVSRLNSISMAIDQEPFSVVNGSQSGVVVHPALHDAECFVPVGFQDLTKKAHFCEQM